MADGLTPDLDALMGTDDALVEARWTRVLQRLGPRFGPDLGIESILFLVGVQSRGYGFQPRLSKKAKQDLIMEGACRVFEALGLYRRAGQDAHGRVIWERGETAPAGLSLDEQEKLLRLGICAYFDGVWNDQESLSHHPDHPS